MEKRAKPIQFRPTQTNRERLEKVQSMGIEMTEVLNGLLEKHFDSFVNEVARSRIKDLQKMIAPR